MNQILPDAAIPPSYPEAFPVVLRDREVARLEARNAELERLLQEALQEARRDPLTSLYNRRGLNEAWWMVQGNYRLALLDLDGFKEINDAYGHAAGDVVLATIAAQLRDYPIAARLGGDEFVVVGRMPGGPVRSWQVTLPQGLSVLVTATVGMTQVLPGDLAGTLLRADAAMYRAKAAAPGSGVFYDPRLDHRLPVARPRVRLRDRVRGVR
ncbi:GGDEF domain-containing protein [Micromonospora rifamycinica]|uniref:GGDEF domain-containing protein n=1 Tax=Micromonospora rifamycinica TaxID=291594 RepID=UPI0033F371C4